MRIAYVVHDLADPAVSRRVATLKQAGAEIALYGFRRVDEAPREVAGVPAHDLGRTQDARLADRALTVLSRRLSVGGWAAEIAKADLVMARNLEMLVLAAAARDRFAPTRPLVYELLDIHSSLLGTGPASRALRWIESRLLRRSAAVLISSPAFERNYLSRHYSRRPPALLVENKVFGQVVPAIPERPAGAPWRIGWFGIIRCRRSLLCLADLVRRFPGQIEVDVRGKLATTALGDSVDLLESTPGLRYYGPYDYFTDLPAIYGAVHFVWAIDYFEAGANSAWLLPNRLYEGGLHGAVPIALKSVETGRWLDARGLGLTIEEPLEPSTQRLFADMTMPAYLSASTALAKAGAASFRWGAGDGDALMAGLSALR